ncbi:venom acid phosphatase Acph-1-like [Rhynchophorus ferrugineus]|uniref:venom acid phosphatase Acph-1-like n=1 Tax=Rhynchophorus ferrugineus TaxID=354439 RepID=UPI003FCE96F7
MSIRESLLLLFLVFCFKSFDWVQAQENDSIILVHVMHRHGDRAPDSNIYSSNPIANESFFQPFGYGGLYTRGKTTAYRVGVALRAQYRNFLGESFTNKYLQAKTTNTDRTKMSLQLVLAGLWPPSREEKFWPCLNWQPIPYNYEIFDRELSATNVCYGFHTMRDAVVNSTSIQEALTRYNDVFEYLSNYTGQDFRTTSKVFDMYLNLQAQEAYGYPVEDWLRPVYPDLLRRITVDQYYIETNSTDLKKFTSGFLLKKIVADSQDKINGVLYPEQRKMFVYSAHERNLAHMLITLGIFDEKVPPFGSYILYELRYIDGVYGFKIYYQNWTTNEPKLMVLPGCSEFCPFDDFVALFSDVFPEDDYC